MKATIVLWLALVVTPVAARALPDALRSACTDLSNRGECGVSACVCDVVNEVPMEDTLFSRAVVMRAASEDRSWVNYTLVLETDGVWADYGLLYSVSAASADVFSDGGIERFDVVEVPGVGAVLRCEFTAKGQLHEEEANARFALATGKLVLVFAQEGELVAVEVIRHMDSTVARIDKKRPPKPLYGAEGHVAWVRDVELTPEGLLRVSAKRHVGRKSKKSSPDTFVGDHPLRTLRALDTIELTLRTPAV